MRRRAVSGGRVRTSEKADQPGSHLRPEAFGSLREVTRALPIARSRAIRRDAERALFSRARILASTGGPDLLRRVDGPRLA